MVFLTLLYYNFFYFHFPLYLVHTLTTPVPRYALQANIFYFTTILMSTVRHDILLPILVIPQILFYFPDNIWVFLFIDFFGNLNLYAVIFSFTLFHFSRPYAMSHLHLLNFIACMVSFVNFYSACSMYFFEFQCRIYYG